MLKLRYAVENRRPRALLSGASGSGKTLLVSQLQRIWASSANRSSIWCFRKCRPNRCWRTWPMNWPLPGEASGNRVEQTVRRIQKFLTQNAAQDQHTVIAIDEAHLLDSSRTWEALRLLMNFDADAEPLFTLLLVGQPALLTQIDRQPALEERLGVKCLLRPFTVDETEAYVNFRLQAAGIKIQFFKLRPWKR